MDHLWGILDLLNLGTGEGGRQGPRVAGICALIHLPPSSLRAEVEILLMGWGGFVVLSTPTLTIILADFSFMWIIHPS